MSGRRVLVLTVVHHPHDGRIRARQVEALLAAGWQVTYAAPWRGHGVPVPVRDPDGPALTCVDVPRARGRRRWAAQRAARRLLRELGPQHDLVLLHDPELVPVTVGLRLPPVVWDVHEDTAAALRAKEWLPAVVRRPTAALVQTVEQVAERRHHLLLSEHRYAERFRQAHPVVPNVPVVPPDPVPAARPDAQGRLRVVYLGSLTIERGAGELVAVAERLHRQAPGRVVVEIMGPAHGRAVEVVQQARRAGLVTWSGYVPNSEALDRVEGALAGLSLLQDQPNFRHSMPTKVVEYLGRAVPVITTALPVAADVVERSGGGLVVPFGPVDRVADQAVAQLLAWVDDPEQAIAAGRAGHRLVRAELDWAVHGPRFVAALETFLA